MSASFREQAQRLLADAEAKRPTYGALLRMKPLTLDLQREQDRVGSEIAEVERRAFDLIKQADKADCDIVLASLVNTLRRFNGVERKTISAAVGDLNDQLHRFKFGKQ